MTSYDTVTEALAALKLRGYTIDFNINFDQLICDDLNACLRADEFEIVEMYRFEGDTNPSDEDVVYAVESKDGELKGSLSMAFGTYANEIDQQFLKKLSFHHDK